MATHSYRISSGAGNSRKTVQEQMMEPYQLIIFMQLVIVIGDSTTVLMLAIIAKIAA